MKKKIFFNFLLLLSINLFAQTTQTVKGVVTDSQSDFPLDSVTITVLQNQKEYVTTTNFDGEFVIENVPLGKIDIIATYNGFETQQYNHLNLVAGKELVVNFNLLEKLEKLENLSEVVISTTKKRQNVLFVSASNASFNVEQTNQYAGSLNDVSRMAMNYAGVSGNDDSRNDIIVRGNNPASLLWVLEGAAIPSPNHYSTNGSSGGPVSMLNINTLSKSDFLSGAFPANFGNTTSAAFDLQFRKPNNTKTEFVGQLGFAGAEIGVEGPFSKNKKASYLFNYRYSTLALFDVLGIDLSLGTAIPKYQDINTVINIPTKNNGNVKIWAIGGVSKIKFKNDESEDSNNIYLSNSNLNLSKENKNIISGITHKYFFNKKTSSKISLTYSNIDETVKVDTLNTNNNQLERTFFMDIITQYTTIDAKINSKINSKNKIETGVANTNYNIKLTLNNYVDFIYNDVNRNTNLASVYVNWQHRFTNNLILNSGLRYQYFTLNKQESLEPRLGLKYRLKNDANLSVAYGLHSNINPMLSYFTKQEIAPNNYQYANTNLEFVKSHHFIVGYQQKLDENLKFKAEAYYQYLFNVPVSHQNEWYSVINSGFGADGGSQIYFDPLFNEGKGENYGIDLTFEMPINNGFYALLTGSLYESKYLATDNIWRNTAWNGNYMMSFLSGKEININNKSSFGVDINLNFAGGRRAAPIDINQSIIEQETVYYLDRIFEERLKDYFRTDIKLSYKRSGKKISQEWQVDLRNIFNRKNIFSQRFNKTTNNLQTNYQTGFLPVVQYRILF